jgi:hypothetical protein
MKLSEHVKQALRRDHRGTATIMEKQASVLCNSARIEPDPLLRATQVAAVNIWPSLIEEFRTIADKADEHLRRDDITHDEFAPCVTARTLSRLKSLRWKKKFAVRLRR